MAFHINNIVGNGALVSDGERRFWSLAFATTTDTRWALFKDFRGVALCEPVNDGLVVFSYTRRAVEEKKHILTRKIITRGRPAEVMSQVWFNPKYYHPADPRGTKDRPMVPYVFDPAQVYLREQRWGPVKPLAFFTEAIGRELQYQFRRIHPDGMVFGTKGGWNKSASPHYMTDHLVSHAIQLSDIQGVIAP